MWADIVYTCDRVRTHVPVSFFKDSKSVEDELKVGTIRPQYDVFWSRNPEDTPKLVVEREGRIVNVEKIKKTPANMKAGPLAGYYEANLLHYAESKEALLKLLKTRQGRRPVIPATGENALQDTATSGEKRAEKRKKEIRLSQARLENLKRLCLESPRLPEFNKNALQAKVSKEESSDSDGNCSGLDGDNIISVEYEDLVRENLNLKDEVKELRHSQTCVKEEAEKYRDALKGAEEEIQILKQELTRVRKQNESLVDLNIFWQEEARKKNLYTQHSKLSTTLASSSSMSWPPSNDPLTVQETNEELLPNTSFLRGSEEGSNENLPAEGMIFFLNEEQPLQYASQEGEVLSAEDYAFNVIPPPGVNAITKGHLERILKSVDAGQRGDSRFVKNLCDVLWTREELNNRSAAGRACPTIEGSVAKPACSPEKKQYMKYLLSERIEKELPKPTKKEEEDRLKKLNDFLRSKIKAVQREMRTKQRGGEEKS